MRPRHSVYALTLFSALALAACDGGSTNDTGGGPDAPEVGGVYRATFTRADTSIVADIEVERTGGGGFDFGYTEVHTPLSGGDGFTTTSAGEGEYEFPRLTLTATTFDGEPGPPETAGGTVSGDGAAITLGAAVFRRTD